MARAWQSLLDRDIVAVHRVYPVGRLHLRPSRQPCPSPRPDRLVRRPGSRRRQRGRYARRHVDSGKASCVTRIELAQCSAALEYEMLECGLLMQVYEQEILRNVDQSGVPTAGSLRGVTCQPTSGDTAHVASVSSRGSNGSRPSATLKRLSKRRLTRGRPNQVTLFGLVGCSRSAVFGATPLSR